MADTQPEKAVYACEKYSGFSFRCNETHYRFEKHQLTVEGAKAIDELDAFLLVYPQISSKVKKVSLAAAEALVKSHIASHGGAKSGPFNSNSSGQHEATKIAERDATLANMSAEDKQKLLDKLSADSGLIVTEKTTPETAVVENKDEPTPVVTETKPASGTLNFAKKAN